MDEKNESEGAGLPLQIGFWKKGEDGTWSYTGPETLSLTLLKPIQLTPASPAKEQIQLTEPSAEELEKFQAEVIRTGGNNYAGGRILVAANAKLSDAEGRKLGARDLQKAMNFLTGFIEPLLPDGAN